MSHNRGPGLQHWTALVVTCYQSFELRNERVLSRIGAGVLALLRERAGHTTMAPRLAIRLIGIGQTMTVDQRGAKGLIR